MLCKKLAAAIFLLCGLSGSMFAERVVHMANRDAKLYVSGHTGLVGSAIVRRLQKLGYSTIVTRSSKDLDLRVQADVDTFFAQEKPEYVFLAAAKVGGIKANEDFPADFIYDNLLIQTNVIHCAYKYGVKKLIFLGSSCIYPRMCPQPIKEEYLLTGELEKTNEQYAIAKIAGIKMCQAYNRQHGTNFIACMPTNIYGPGDNFDLETSHVLPALLRKFYEAKEAGKGEVVVWGTGTPYREFLHVDDLADAIVFLMRHYSGDEIVNIGTGVDLTIADLARMIKEVVGFEGKLVFDNNMPDGPPKKQLCVDKLRDLGWSVCKKGQEPLHQLCEGIERTFAWCLKNKIFAQ